MSFEWPLLLTSLGLVPVMVGLYVLAQRRRRRYAVRFTNVALLQHVVGRGPGVRRHIPPLLFLLGFAALLVSLARPQAVIAVPRDDAAVVLALDVSGSMAADDMQPTRMAAAKQAAGAFVEALPDGSQVGLVTFSSTATVNASLTRDAQTVSRAIERVSANGGTAIGDGLSLAVDQLAQRPPTEAGETAPPALVVLLSDGQQTDGRVQPRDAAARAQQAGVAVYTVGIGQRGATPRINGTQQVRLDEPTLQGIAEATGGQYFYAAEASQLSRIYAELGSRISWVQERTEVTALVSSAGAVALLAAALLGLRWFQQFP
jgi:Ca-activated chloride channel family protein